MKKIMLMIVTTLLTSNLFAQTCPVGIKQTKPDSQYILVGDNEALVVDSKTGLMWMRCSLGQTWDGSNCTGSGGATFFTWQQGLNEADSFSFAGFDGWRVPTVKELDSLVEPACYSPAINVVIFPNTVSDYYWSSSPYADHTTRAQCITFFYGSHSSCNKISSESVRLVRIEQ
ncbi:MAG: DUF1566 domain-containing protein [Saccharospirillaceae bacterium]|nr:DUF1566 domain-containing protein [Pseudomonadales bacterium]NRB81430.1 DUF1566 domain-containing protein [Saccharospirillaceae bacterium]